ncbi:energy-coupling factor transporter transmembrane protein EcfT [Oribacterium sp. oral taxon 102]|uniref:energy-coupling factor transporter transmembrane component T family protein n=1 Tax=Oribacterium sp. oral taxon 102 TaxID=671214 RepID=UPI0015C0991A|nr:energy-coupling factor transporter transmembrane component T [Oribacterium sp. oral taxon 102]NWO20962.1 energy-coupling factor transporter transmembrane protein EcfT [Oribacterium sp. oral taxon 102]
MKSISLYHDNGSFLTRLHPFSKLFYVLSAVLFPLLAGGIPPFFLPILLSLALLVSGRILKRALPLLAFSLTIIATILLIQGLFAAYNRTPLLSLGGMRFYREGLRTGLRSGLNILNMLLSFAVLVLSTKPSELVEELEKKGFSPKFGYILNSVFQIIPEMLGGMRTISDAQRSRGMETEGKLSVRLRAFLPLISPVVMSALTTTRERAVALEIRGFSSGEKKTYLYSHPYHTSDRLMKWGSLLLLPLAVFLRLFPF